MRLSKEAKFEAQKYIDLNSEVTVEEVAQILKANMDPPDVAELLDREFKQSARRLMASQRDKKGTRKLFAVERSGRFVNIEQSEDAADLLLIQDRISRNIQGHKKDLKKLKNRLKVISGQISMSEWFQSIGETNRKEKKYCVGGEHYEQMRTI